MKSRHWVAALLGLGTGVLIGGGFLHHHERLNVLQRLQLDDTQVQALRGELVALRTTQDQLQTELDELVNQLTTFNRAHAQLEEHITRQQTQLLALQNPPEDPRWHSLSLRIQHLETRPSQHPKPLASVRKTTPRAAPPRSAPSRPARPALPLLIGLELRGPERFLAVAPAGSQTLKEVQLLRRGERFGAWTLQRLEQKTAVFTSPGQPDQTLALP
jgi:uncharacterized membrane-anchored protein YhcB (DUF1043 family)